MLRILPHTRFSLVSAHPVKSLVERLEAVTEPDLPLFFKSPEPWFYGDVDTGGFELMRNEPGRNGFAPRIVGDFSPQDPRGSETWIHVELSPRPITAAFLILWVALAAMIGVAIIATVLSNEIQGDEATAILPPILLAVGWSIGHFSFWIGARHVKGELQHIFEAREVAEPD